MTEATTTQPSPAAPETTALGTTVAEKPTAAGALYPEKPAEAVPPVPAEVPPASEATPPNQPEAVETKAEEPPPEPTAPDYSVLKLPEGMKPDSPEFTSFKTRISAMNAGKGLDPKDAQTLVDTYAEASKAADEAVTKAWADKQKEWQETLKADRELGGEKLQKEVIPAVNRTMNMFLSGPEVKELKEFLNITGAGNHPTMVKLMYAMSRAFNEGRGVNAGGPVHPKQSPAEALYGTDGVSGRTTNPGVQ